MKPFALHLQVLALVFCTSTAWASCRQESAPERQFERARQVYLAHIVLVEWLSSEPDPNQNESDAPDFEGQRYRLVLQPTEVFKGEVPRRVEKFVDTTIFTLGGRTLRLQDHPVETRVLMFDPDWDSSCSATVVVDEAVEAGLLARVREWASVAR